MRHLPQANAENCSRCCLQSLDRAALQRRCGALPATSGAPRTTRGEIGRPGLDVP